MTTDKYILDGRTPVPCEDLLTWGRWFEKAERHVAETEIGKVRVSTVFLGLDHQFGNGPPLLFETMIFGWDDDPYYQDRYSTWEEAERGHEKAVALVKGSYNPSNAKSPRGGGQGGFRQ